jgi:hypothetical protein
VVGEGGVAANAMSAPETQGPVRAMALPGAPHAGLVSIPVMKKESAVGGEPLLATVTVLIVPETVNELDPTGETVIDHVPCPPKRLPEPTNVMVAGPVAIGTHAVLP